MASPQTENGYTRIANELLDAVIRYPFSKRQQKVLLAVIRKTYGFNKKSDEISMTLLANMTGISLANVSRTVAELVGIKALLKRQGKQWQRLAINKDYGEWAGCQNSTLPKQQDIPCQNSKLGVAKTANTKDNLTKDKQTKDRGWGDCPESVDQKAWQEWTAYKRGKPAKATVTKLVNFLSAYPAPVQREIVDTSIRNGWKGLFPPKAEKINPFAAGQQRLRELINVGE